MDHEKEEPLDQEDRGERAEPIDPEELAGVVEAIFADRPQAHQFRLRSVEVLEGHLEAVFLGREEDEADGPYGARLPAPESVGGRVDDDETVQGSAVESQTLTAWAQNMLVEPFMSSYDAGRAGVWDRGVFWFDLES